MKSSVIIIPLTGLFAGTVDAFWRMECRARLGLARIDPLVSPGQISQHAHSIHGSGGFSSTATYDDLINSDCTSCAVEQDKSVYWHPALYFEDTTTGKFEAVEQKGGMLAYYFLNKGPGDKRVTGFPKGFRMIAGDNARRNYSGTLGDVSKPDPEKSVWAMLNQIGQADLEQRAIGFNCLNYGKEPEGTLYRHFLPDKDFLDANCANGVRFEVMFPSCWTGNDVDSTNHKDHVAYPSLVMTGDCPETHPIRLIGLMYETIWDTYAFKDRSGRFVISNGDVRGFGYHADFMMGWDEAFLQQAADTCTDLSGLIGACPLFKIQGDDKAAQCKLKLPSALSNEDTSGYSLPSLPGKVAIQLGPGPATDNNPPPATSAEPAPILSYSPGSTATGETYLPGQVLKVSTELASAAQVSAAPTEESQAPAIQVAETQPEPEPTSTASPPLPPPPAPTPTETSTSTSEEVNETFKAVSTQYVTAGNVVSKIVWAEETVYVTEYEDATSTATLTWTRTVTANAWARRHLRHLRQHAGHHY